MLRLVYAAETRSYIPGDPDPEIMEAERMAEAATAKRPVRRTGFRMNQKQRKAIELRAMRLAIDYFKARGAAVRDVSANRSYDLEVEEEGSCVTVEVKGTVSDGLEILITHPEVVHQRRAHPHNALALVSGVQLEGPPDAPVAAGGDLRVVQPWPIDDSALTPVSYRYSIRRSVERQPLVTAGDAASP